MSRGNLIERLEKRFLLASQTFSNPASITIEDSWYPPTAAVPYPSNVNVSGVSGTVTNISAQIKNFGHDYPADVDILLVSPAGTGIILMSDAGSNFSVSNKTLTFDDSGGQLPDLSQINTGTYRPTNCDDGSNDDFPDAAYSGQVTHLYDLNSENPNGNWSLYVVDDQTFNAGQIGGGWSITITTQVVTPPAPSTPDLVAASDTGVSSTDNITQSTTPTFSGTAQANSTVKIYADGIMVGSGAASSGGVYAVATSGLTNGTRSVTATATSGGVTSPASAALSVTIDTVAPSIGAQAFNYASAQNLIYDFPENVGPTLAASDLTLQNLSSGTTVPTGSIGLAYNSSTNRATISFPGYVLADGNYRATMAAAGVTDVAGNPLASANMFDFFVLAGDANHDRMVDVTDLGILATNWQGTGKNFTQADFNYDSKLDVTDLGILATNWQKSLPPAAAPLAHVSRHLASPAPAIGNNKARAQTERNRLSRLVVEVELH